MLKDWYNQWIKSNSGRQTSDHKCAKCEKLKSEHSHIDHKFVPRE